MGKKHLLLLRGKFPVKNSPKEQIYFIWCTGKESFFFLLLSMIWIDLNLKFD